jgi:hypothetical protein
VFSDTPTGIQKLVAKTKEFEIVGDEWNFARLMID